MSYFTLRKIRFQHRPYFALPAVEKPASISPEEQMKRDAIQAFPGLKDIADKVSPLELYNRAKVMSKLKSMIENPEKTF